MQPLQFLEAPLSRNDKTMSDKLQKAAQQTPEALIASSGSVNNDVSTKVLNAPDTLRETSAEPTHGCHIDLPEGEYDACVLDAGNRDDCVYARKYGSKAKEKCGEWKPIKVIPSKAALPPPFQQRVQPWLLECFGAEIAADRAERNHRFLEESLELVQALGCTANEAHQLVDYVFGRPVGDPPQEVGGVMVTLAALCLANSLDMHDAGEVELARISAPEMVARIRAKQAAKPQHSPLPTTAAQPPQPAAAAKEPVATLHDDGYWTPMKTEAGRQLNERLMRAGSRVEVYIHPVPHPAQVDRGDATNLARNMLTVHDCKGITSKGVRVLSEAVMAMDAALKALPPAAVPSDTAIAMWSDHRFSNGRPVPASYRVSLIRDALEKWGTPPAAPQSLLPESGTPTEREKHINELLSILETGPAESSSYYDGFTEKYVCCECFAKHEDSLEIQHEESCSHHVAVANARRRAELVKLIRAAD